MYGSGHGSIKEFAQNEVAQFGVYESIVDHLFPIICSFFLGSWSDSFGRKWLLYFYFLIRWHILDISTFTSTLFIRVSL